MDARLAEIVSSLRRSNPPAAGLDLQLQDAIVNAGLKHDLSESDLVAAAEELGLDPGAFVEEMASWL